SHHKPPPWINCQRSSPELFPLGRPPCQLKKRKILLVLVAVSVLLSFSPFSKESETATPASNTPPPPLPLPYSDSITRACLGRHFPNSPRPLPPACAFLSAGACTTSPREVCFLQFDHGDSPCFCRGWVRLYFTKV
uniref:Uncharacterized protein n=1 Tax=Aegilops tauschii subsp. strangulata TaxID=200361 RepID=A0A453K055_AEGTS